MKTLILYDNSGVIFAIAPGTYPLPNGGIQYLEIEMPDGKYISSVDVSVTPHQPVYKDIVTDSSQIKDMQSTMAELTYALMQGGLL